MELLQCTATLCGGIGQCYSCNALPHWLEAVGSGTPAIHCLTAWGQWVVQLLQCTATPPGGGGQWNSCNARAHRLGGGGVLPRRWLLPKEWNSRNALPQCPRAMGSATLATHCRTGSGQWAVELLQYTASLPGGSGQCNSCNALPHRLGAVGSGTPAMRGHTSCGDGESCLGGGRCLKTELLQCTASLPGGSGQCNSYNTLPHWLEAVGSGTPVVYYLIAWGQWAVQVVQCTATLSGGGGQWNSSNARADQRGGRGVLPIRRSLLKKEILQCTASLPRGSGRCNSCNALPTAPVELLREGGDKVQRWARRFQAGVFTRGIASTQRTEGIHRWTKEGRLNKRKKPNDLFDALMVIVDDLILRWECLNTHITTGSFRA